MGVELLLSVFGLYQHCNLSKDFWFFTAFDWMIPLQFFRSRRTVPMHNYPPEMYTGKACLKPLYLAVSDCDILHILAAAKALNCNVRNVGS
jgi:hypothetical protein